MSRRLYKYIRNRQQSLLFHMTIEPTDLSAVESGQVTIEITTLSILSLQRNIPVICNIYIFFLNLYFVEKG